MKIYISGVSGSGKSTLANYISAKYRIPLLNGSAKVLWKAYNIKSHKEMIEECVKDPEFGLEFQYKLLTHRKDLMLSEEKFVMDRSPLDGLVYFLLQVAPNLDSSKTMEFINAYKGAYPSDKYTQIFLDMPKDTLAKNLAIDGMRIDNIYYQTFVNDMFQKQIQHNWLEILQPKDKSSLLHIPDWQWEKRIKTIDKHLKPKYPWLEKIKL